MTSQKIEERVEQLKVLIKEISLENANARFKLDKLNNSWFAFKFQKKKVKAKYDKSLILMTILIEYTTELKHKLFLIVNNTDKKRIDHHENKIEDYIKKQITDRDKQ